MLATEYANYYGLQPQGKSESESDFKARIAQELRQMNKPIEAHEAYSNERYEESSNVMDGIFGAVAQALSGQRYSGNQLDNDIVAGRIIRHKMSPEGKRQEQAKRMMAVMLSAGLSPNDIKKLTE